VENAYDFFDALNFSCIPGSKNESYVNIRTCNQSNEKRQGLPPIDAPEEGPGLATHLLGMIRAEVSGGKVKT
jgi:hypothetical protein